MNFHLQFDLKKFIFGNIIGIFFLLGILFFQNYIVKSTTSTNIKCTSLNISPQKGGAQLKTEISMQLDNVASNYAYKLDFGDSEKASGLLIKNQSKLAVKHTYKSPGSYLATFLIDNNIICSGKVVVEGEVL